MLERMGSQDRAAVVAFSSEVHVVAPFHATRAQTRALLEPLEADEESSTTALFDGIQRSIELIRESENLPRRAFAIVFSDGVDSDGRHTPREIVELGRGDELRPGTPIFAIGHGRLVIMSGARAGESESLQRGLLRIGGLAENDMVPESAASPRYHAEIRRSGRDVELKDLGSSNGTYVNGMPVATTIVLPGDQLRFADIDVVYER